MRLTTFDTQDAWLGAGLAAFVAAARLARDKKQGRLDICLAGGTSPAPLYRALAASEEFAQALQGLELGLWLGDEREVPEDHAERNGRLVAEAFGQASWPHSLHLWPPGPAAGAATAYATELADSFQGPPVFDLALLGLGEDGHTASLFPGDSILSARQVLALPSLAPSEPRRRMSLTLGCLQASRAIAFWVRGQGKKAIVEALAREDPGLPASALAGAQTRILYCSL